MQVMGGKAKGLRAKVQGDRKAMAAPAGAKRMRGKGAEMGGKKKPQTSVSITMKPNRKQAQAFRARKRHVAYGGARGGGKSWFVREKARMLAIRYPGIHMLIVRKTYPELMKNHVEQLLVMLSGMASYNRQEKIFRFFNGSMLTLGYCACDGDADQYQGTEYDVIFIDEATNLKQEWIQRIVACMRGVNDFPKRVYYTCNPGGVGHGYIKRLFIDRRYEPGENPEDYEFIQALVTDNVALMKADPTYIRQLDALPRKLRDAWRFGRWDIFEGQFFEDFVDSPEHYQDRQWTHVIDPFDVNPRWTVYRSFDWGYAKPFSCAWWAVDYEGVIYRILELYGGGEEPNVGCKWTPNRVFAEIHRVESEHPWLRGKQIHGVADPAIWNAEAGPSIAEEAAKAGVYFVKGDNSRIPGWMQCHYRLAFSEDGYPQMYVFSTCRAFIRTIPLLMYDTHVPEDLDTEGEDHAADEWRYMCMARPIEPAQTEVMRRPVYMVDPLDQLGRRERGRGRPAQPT